MGNVLHAMQKFSQATGETLEPTFHVISTAVADAVRLAKKRLDDSAAPAEATATPAPQPEAFCAENAPTAAASPSIDADARDEEIAAPEYSPLLTAHHQPLSLVSEQIRQLRTALVKTAGSFSATEAIRCMITSAQAREGKSVTAANLAYSFSELTHKRTLLIDADLRRGRVAELYGQPNLLGLADILAHRCTVEEGVIHTVRANLDVVTTGQVELNTLGELLSDEAADAAIRELVRGYDHVIFDTPPATSMADAALIGRWANMALLVVHINKTPRSLVEQAREMLASAGVNLAGLIAVDESAVGRKYSRYSYA